MKPMTVWLVVESADWTTEAVFATEEAAKAYVEERRQEYVEAMLKRWPDYVAREMWAIEKQEVRT